MKHRKDKFLLGVFLGILMVTMAVLSGCGAKAEPKPCLLYTSDIQTGNGDDTFILGGPVEDEKDSELSLIHIFGAEGYEVVAINDLTDPKMLAHLLKYDTAQGGYAGHIGEGKHTVEAVSYTHLPRDPAGNTGDRRNYFTRGTGIFRSCQ